MNEALFSDSFFFVELRFKKYKYTDNMGGIQTHFIGFMRKGHAKIVSADEVTEIREGELFYLPLGCRYRSYWYGDPDICFDSYAFRHYPKGEALSFRHATVPMTEAARVQLDALAADKRVSCASVAHLYALLAEMLPFLPARERSAKEALLDRAQKYIKEHPDFKARELSRFCGISESGLYGLFKEGAGETPVDFKNRLLTEKAAFLLRTTDLSAEEIGQTLGFSSAAYFRRLFASFYGMTPRVFRQKHQSKV